MDEHSKDDEHSKSVDLRPKLKGLILSQGRAIFGSKYPPGHTFDVVIHRLGSYSNNDPKFEAHLIVCTPPNSYGQWVSLCTNESNTTCTSGTSAMRKLLENLQNMALASGDHTREGAVNGKDAGE